MFAWFQRLLPQTGDFFGMFEAHAATLVAAAEALTRLADDDFSTTGAAAGHRTSTSMTRTISPAKFYAASAAPS